MNRDSVISGGDIATDMPVKMLRNEARRKREGDCQAQIDAQPELVREGAAGNGARSELGQTRAGIRVRIWAVTLRTPQVGRRAIRKVAEGAGTAEEAVTYSPIAILNGLTFTLTPRPCLVPRWCEAVHVLTRTELRTEALDLATCSSGRTKESLWRRAFNASNGGS